MKNSRVQEPNVETDHLESSTSGSVNLLNQSFDTRFQPTRQDVCWSGGHALLHQVVQNQPDGQVCSAYQRQAHVSSFSNGGLQRMLSLFHSLLTPLPLQRWKSFRSTFLPLVWWSYVATIQPNITPTLVQPCTVAARTGLPTDTIWNLGRGEAKHTRHTYWCSHSTCKL